MLSLNSVRREPELNSEKGKGGTKREKERRGSRGFGSDRRRMLGNSAQLIGIRMT